MPRINVLAQYKLPFAKRSIPDGLKHVPDVAVVIARGKRKVITWGWREWCALAPLVAASVHVKGRSAEAPPLSAALMEAQATELPKALRRTASAIYTSVSDSSAAKTATHPREVLHFLVDKLGLHDAKPLPKKADKKRGAAGRATALQHAAQAPAAAPVPAPRFDPPPTASASDTMMQLPIAAFVPVAREIVGAGVAHFLASALQPILDRHALIMGQQLREAIVAAARELGPQPITRRTRKSKQSAEPEPPAATIEATVQPAVPAFEPPAQVPHTMEDQVAQVAKALGIDTTQAKRESVLVVGLHHAVEQEVRKFYGHAFHFTFKNPDDFRGANDIPASTDAILVARKRRLPEDVVKATRRYNIPMTPISNSSNAVFDALRNAFPGAPVGRMMQ